MDTATILERVRSLANEAMFTVALQYRRLNTVEPEDEMFVMRWWADLQFMILALCRLRRAMKIACKVPAVAEDIKAALGNFDDALPHLSSLRNVGEHIDEYAVDSSSRHDKTVSREQIQVGTWDGIVYEWLGARLKMHDALIAAEELIGALQTAMKKVDQPQR
jgi:hypothetical protein